MALHQRSRVNWLTYGDKNSTFFHACINQRRQRSQLLMLKTGVGNWVGDEEEVLANVHCCISDDMNVKLIEEVSVEEVKKAAFQLGSTLESLGQYRPMGQCNFSVKVITKVMANRLKSHLQKVGSIQWVMQCISTVNSFVVENREARVQINPRWGLRQGDPQSPYLVVLVKDVLLNSRAVTKLRNPGDLRDSFWSENNIDKSSVTFSSNICDNDKQLVYDLLDVPLMRSDAKIATPKPRDCSVDLVAQVIDQDRGTWRRDVMEQIVSQEEMLAITAMPLSQCKRNDTLIWHYTRDSAFSVKSGYHMAVQAYGGGNFEGCTAYELSGKLLMIGWQVWKARNDFIFNGNSVDPEITMRRASEALHNVLVAHEAFHYLKLKKRLDGLLALKLDFNKAYDRVEWDFLEAFLLKMGFHSRRVQWVMQCISTVNFFVVVNGEARVQINLERGLRQGDPRSPYLFVLVKDVLSNLISSAREANSISGWIPELKRKAKKNRRIATPKPRACNVDLVAQVIDQDRGTWRRDVIEQIVLGGCACNHCHASFTIFRGVREVCGGGYGWRTVRVVWGGYGGEPKGGGGEREEDIVVNNGELMAWGGRTADFQLEGEGLVVMECGKMWSYEV
ncbi:hypothetical protein RHSIM_Rhsim03G0157700 [Rhododendron simsii]|uniref:Reverse transcriptase domain-containing protein n=1 Tax=Rhododendron simsii TaxID=118357 RepID=A0A834LTX5_RHOSS|nr:hypothetical protein RHSIM_Rhsim03G0157700 [Rhododendron simsii]